NWMRNFEGDNFFDRTLRIGSIQSSAAVGDPFAFQNIGAPIFNEPCIPTAKGGPSSDMDAHYRAFIARTEPMNENRIQDDNNMQFFPESGQLVSGNLTKVGFKALRAEGLGIAVQGHLVDQSGKRVAEFESEYAGIGSFSFTPQAGQQY